MMYIWRLDSLFSMAGPRIDIVHKYDTATSPRTLPMQFTSRVCNINLQTSEANHYHGTGVSQVGIKGIIPKCFIVLIIP